MIYLFQAEEEESKKSEASVSRTGTTTGTTTSGSGETESEETDSSGSEDEEETESEEDDEEEEGENIKVKDTEAAQPVAKEEESVAVEGEESPLDGQAIEEAKDELKELENVADKRGQTFITEVSVATKSRVTIVTPKREREDTRAGKI